MRKKKKNPSLRAIRIIARVNAKEMHEILARAHLYSGGELSRYIRKALLNYTEKKKAAE